MSIKNFLALGANLSTLYPVVFNGNLLPMHINKSDSWIILFEERCPKIPNLPQ